MTKRRTIDPKIRVSETFSSLTYRQRDLWMGLILVADDQGRMPGQPAYIRSVVWPYDDILLSEIDADLAALEAIGNILRYQVDGRSYIQLVNWHKYQANAEWLGLSDYPAPEGWVDHARYHGKGNKIVTLNWENRNAETTLKVGSGLPSQLSSNDEEDDGDGEDDEEGEAESEQEPELLAGGSLPGSGGGQIMRNFLELKNFDVREPALSELARLEYVTPEKISYHCRNAPSIGAAIIRIRGDWDIPGRISTKQKSPFEAFIQR